MVLKGNFLETASAAFGVTPHGVRVWMRRGAKALRQAERSGRKVAKKDRESAGFFTAIKRAMAQSESNDLEDIKKAREWQSKAWRLERRFPDRWGKREPRENDADVAGRLTVKFRPVKSKSDADA